MFNRDISKHLLHWSQKPSRKPLVLRGARQVGKTTVIREFGKSFAQYIYLNLEIPVDRNLFAHSSDITTLVQSIFISRAQQFSQRADTLLFIDEIQAFPGAFNMLRYFYEIYPEIK